MLLAVYATFGAPGLCSALVCRGPNLRHRMKAIMLARSAAIDATELCIALICRDLRPVPCTRTIVPDVHAVFGAPRV